MAETQTVINQPYFEGDIRKLLDSSNQLINQPYRNYKTLGDQGLVDPLIAPFAQDTVNSFDLARSGIGAYQPYMQTADAMSLQSYDQGNQLLNTGSQYGSLDPYLNPYQQNVTDTTMQQMRHEQELQQDKLDAEAALGGAYGNSRHGLAEVEMERVHDQNRALTLSNLNYQGYTNAQQAMEAHRARQLQGGQGIGQLGNSMANIQGQLGDKSQQWNLTDVNTLGGIGSLQEGKYQDQLNSNYQQWQMEEQNPYVRAGWMSDILQGVPSTQSAMTSSVAPQPSTMSQTIGAAGQVATAGQQFGWWGNQNGAS